MASPGAKLISWNTAAPPEFSSVTALAATGERLALGRRDGQIWIYHVSGLNSQRCPRAGGAEAKIYPLALLTAHSAAIVCMHIVRHIADTPEQNEDAVLCASTDGDLTLWSMTDGRCIRRAPVPLPFRPTSIQILLRPEAGSSLEGLVVVSGRSTDIYVLGVSSLEVIWSWKDSHPTWVSSLLLFDRKGQYRRDLITCTTDGTLRLWCLDPSAFCGGAGNNGDVPANTSVLDLHHFDTNTPPSPSPHTYSIDSSLESISVKSSSAPTDAPGPAVLEAQFVPDVAGSSRCVHMCASSDGDYVAVVFQQCIKVMAVNDCEIQESVEWEPAGQHDSRLSGAAFIEQDWLVYWTETGDVGLCGRRSGKTGQDGNIPQSHTTPCIENKGGGFEVVTALGANNAQHATHPLLFRFVNDPRSLTVTVHDLAYPEIAGLGAYGELPLAATFEVGGLWRKWLDALGSPGAVTALYLSRNNKLIVGRENGDILIVSNWHTLLQYMNGARRPEELEDELEVLSGHEGTVTALLEWAYPTSVAPSSLTNEFRSESSPMFLCSAAMDMTIKVWDIVRGEEIATIPVLSSPVVQLLRITPYPEYTWDSSVNTSLAYSMKLLILGITENNAIVLLSMKQLDCIYTTAPQARPIERITYNGECNELILLHAGSFSQKIVLDRLLDWAAGDCDDLALPSYTIDVNVYKEVPHSHYYDVTKTDIRLVGSRRCPIGLSVMYLPEFFELLMARSSSSSSSYPSSPLSLSRNHGVDSRSPSSRRRRMSLAEIGLGSRPLSQKSGLHLLSPLLAWGLDAKMDQIKVSSFGISRPPPNMTVSLCNDVAGAETYVFPPPQDDPVAQWCLSPTLNAQRLLSILSLVKSALKDHEQEAVRVINFYVGILAERVGPKFKQLPLAYLARYWISPSVTFQKAARTLFLSTIQRLTDNQRRTVLQYWSAQLSMAATNDLPHLYCALIVVCLIGSEFSGLLPAHTAENVALLLEDLTTDHSALVEGQMLAIELFSRGFSVWKAYVDCPRIIRALVWTTMSITDPAANQTHEPHHSSSVAMSQSRDGGKTSTTQLVSMTASKSAPGHPQNVPPMLVTEGRSPVVRDYADTPPPPQGFRSARGAIYRSAESEVALSDSGIASPRHKNARAVSHHFGSSSRLDTLRYAVESPPPLPPPPLWPESEVRQLQSTTVSPTTLTASAFAANPQPKARQQQQAGVGRSGISFSLVAMAKSALMQICALDIEMIARTILDMLNDVQDPKVRRDSLQLLSLVVTKYAKLMYPYLDQLMQAIVLSIDPKHISTRKALIRAAGTTLQDIVRLYGCVSFNSKTQYLAVGSPNGLCTIYDLRTCTRSAVLNGGASGNVTAVAISPNGDLVATFMQSTSQVAIWNPSPSILSMVAHSLWSGWYGGSSDNNSRRAKKAQSATTTTSAPVGGSQTHSRSSLSSDGQDEMALDSSIVSGDPIKTIDIPKDFIPKNIDQASMALSKHTQLRWTASKTILLAIDDAQFTFSV